MALVTFHRWRKDLLPTVSAVDVSRPQHGSLAVEMIDRKAGWIVNIGSISVLSGNAEQTIYSTAKAAVHEYTRCLAAQ